MTELTSIVRSADGTGWQCYTAAKEIIIANSLDEVIPALQRIERLTEQGYTAIGYVSYEAAPAFDSSLSCQEASIELLKFVIYKDASDWLVKGDTDADICLGPELGKPDYVAAITAIKQHLAAGDSYQVNFTQRLRGICLTDPELLFARLLQQQESNYALFMADEDRAIVSVSPELFFHLDGNAITMQPMKGTRPRGICAETDRQLREELVTSEKERAENLMIVDMIRNDLGRIAEAGSVRVENLFEILQLPTVWQQVSTVKAETDADLVALFSALFPSASITGAPKRQTMSIIKQLETSPRGVYTGALGVIRPGRRMQFNVGIRTLAIDPRTHQAEYGVGSGVIWDSRADAEWRESLIKARVIEQGRSTFKLLETMAYEPGSGVQSVDLHLQRLQKSAEHFGFSLRIEDIRQQLQQLSARNKRRIRLTAAHDGNFVIEDQELTAFSEPVSLKLACKPVNSRDVFLRHKTTNRRIYDYMKSLHSDSDDVILWNENGELTETTIFNLYLEIDGQIVTPDLSSGLLPGIGRRKILDSGKAREAVLTVSDLQRASRIWVGNRLRGLLAARLLD